MTSLTKKLILAMAIASTFSLSTPMISAHAEDKKQCAVGEKWDKRTKQCVDASSY